MQLKGIYVNIFPKSIYNGNPEGWEIPSRYAEVTISPESRNPIEGARARRYTAKTNINKSGALKL